MQNRRLTKETVFVYDDVEWFYLLNSDKYKFKTITSLDGMLNNFIFDNNDYLEADKLILSGFNSKLELEDLKFVVFDWRRKSDLDMLKDIVRYTYFTIPKTYFSNGTIRILCKLDFDKEYYVKAKKQARGVGKYCGKPLELREMIKDIRIFRIEKEEFNEKYKIDVGNVRYEDEKYVLYKALASNEYFYLQEKVEFDAEYRIVACFNGFIIIEKREGYEYNSKEQRKHYKITLEEFKKELGSRLSERILEESKRFITKLKYPAISLDVWVNKEKEEIGLFEWSSEFGIEYDSKTLGHLRDNLIESVETLLDSRVI